MEEWLDRIDHEVFFTKSCAVRWLKEVEVFDTDSLSQARSHSSRHSYQSSQRSSKSRVVKEEAELAALKVRKQFAESKNSLQKLEKINEEIAVREAKIEVY